MNRKWVLFSLAVASVIVLIFGGLFLFRPDPGFQVDERAEDGAVTASELERRLLEELQSNADASQFSFKINCAPQFENGAAEGDLYIVNPEDNAYDMRVELLLDETGETLYESGPLHPGDAVEAAALARELPRGDYAVTAIFTALLAPDGVEVGRTAAGLTIHILS